MSVDFEHIIYNPIKQNVKVKDEGDPYTLFIPRNLNKLDSLLSFRRRHKSLKYLKRNLDLSEISLSHAHTLTNDGILAYSLFQKYNIPYVLTIRNTDVNFSIKYKKHLKPLFNKTIKSAELIIFPNHVYKDKLMTLFKGNAEVEKKLEKSIVIPNGIDGYWHKNKKAERKTLENKKVIDLIYVGRIYKNKNLHRVLKAITEINEQKKYKLKFNVVGKVINQKYFKNLKKNYKFKYFGTKNKEEISEIMKSMDIFTMPSENETFGLVFLEALSQNLPIVYTKDEGIDRYFSENVYGVAAHSKDYQDIKKAIIYIINNYNEMQKNLDDKEFLNEFKWETIGKKYDKIYREKCL
ncbi:glycosyltransferase family 4 protein [Staphylococcus piscifermentans]